MGSNPPPFQYLVLHKSAAAKPGLAAVYAAHAASEAIRTLPVHPETAVGVLVVEKSDMLEALAQRLSEAGIHHRLITEPEHPYLGAAVALGVEPLPKDRVRPYMAGLQALR